MRILFALLGVGLFLAAISSGNGDGVLSALLLFVQVESVALVFLGSLCFTLATHHPRKLLEALLAGLGNAPLSLEEGHQHIRVLDTFRNFTLAFGALGVTIGLILMLSNLDDPTQIGPSMALALLSAFYAVMLAELFLGPQINRVSIRAGQSEDPPPPTSSRRGSAPLTTLFVLLGVATLAGTTMLMSASFTALYNFLSVIITVIGTASLGLAYHSPAEVGSAFAAGFKAEPIGAKPGRRHAALLSNLRMLAIACGVLGTFIGLIKMLQDMSDPTTIGPAMSVALLTTFYGILLSELTIGPFHERVRVNTALEATGIPTARPIGVFLVGLVLTNLFCFSFMLIAMCDFG
jgi:flagellar motor component MotA